MKLARKLPFVLILFLFLCAFFALPASCFGTASDIYVTVGKEKISVLDVDEKKKLFLPACADLSALAFVNASDGQTRDRDCSGGRAVVFGSLVTVERGSLPAVFVTLENGSDDFARINVLQSYAASGKIRLIDEAGRTVYSGELEKFWGHGLTSFVSARDKNVSVKNSFNIKLKNKTELTDGAGNIKKYVLIAPRRGDPGRDTTGISQLAAYETYNGLISDGVADINGIYTDVYVNGMYRGVYILCERMNRGGAIDVYDIEENVSSENESRTTMVVSGDPAIDLGVKRFSYTTDAVLENSDTDISGGYVLEIMFSNYTGCGFETGRGMIFGIKYPDACTREMVSYIASYVQSFENALYSRTGMFGDRHFSDYADMKSFADQALVYGFYSNGEYFRTSTYVYKDRDGKLVFGPVWDFETAAHGVENCEIFFNLTVYVVEQQYPWLQRLWHWGDFMKIMYDENASMLAILDGISARLSRLAEEAGGSWAMDETLWGEIDYPATAAEYLNAISVRKNTWTENIWNPDRYLLYVTVSKTDNGDGTVTLNADWKGTEERKLVWEVVEDDGYRFFASGTGSISVPADGTEYMCSAYGLGNAFCEQSISPVFSSPDLEMWSYPVKAEVAPKDNSVTGDIPSGAGNGKSTVPAVICISAALIAVCSAVIVAFRKRPKT